MGDPGKEGKGKVASWLLGGWTPLPSDAADLTNGSETFSCRSQADFYLPI